MSDDKHNNRMNDLQDNLIEKGREVWLAGLGALSTVEQQGNKFFNNLVDTGKKLEEEGTRLYDSLLERGRTLESDGKARIHDAQDKAYAKKEAIEDKVGDTVSRVEDKVTDVVDKALKRIDVPTRTEVQDLTKKVQALSRKVDKLAKVLSEQKG